MLDGVGVHDRTHILDGPTYDRLKGGQLFQAMKSANLSQTVMRDMNADLATLGSV
jgi:hypothetical protein